MEMPLSDPAAADIPPAARRRPSRLGAVLASGSVRLGGGVLALLVLMAAAAPLLYTIDPLAIDPASGNLLPGAHGEFNSLAGDTFERLFLLGTDSLGRDIWSRVLFGARVSLALGAAVAVAAVALGTLAGVCAGYFRAADSIVMRTMDGLMAIPSILFAITLVAVWGGTLGVVVVAIALPEIPRVARLVRSVVLTVREEAYVEAAVALDTPHWKILARHILPNTLAPLIVQGTYICASAILIEAILSFLGVGLPADIPTWGNVMAEGRLQFNQFPHNVLVPGAFVAMTILAVNLLGDGLRDTLDPKFNRRDAAA
ncbi:ABC transporter permease [Xanthobacter pseudotagetidis]|uniref:ABC transporter permease n=1 Tax=Xanthobacter pseudotagetidis TaxID=3119911 RepID=UPI00372A56DF